MATKSTIYNKQASFTNPKKDKSSALSGEKESRKSFEHLIEKTRNNSVKRFNDEEME